MVSPCNAKAAADKVLEDWDDVCKEMEIPHVLILGTCLGIVRGEGYIEGDNDIDVWVRQEDFPKLAEKLQERGFKPSGDFGVNRHFSRNGIQLDVFYVKNHKYGNHEPYLKTFSEVSYNGRIYNVPSPVEKYLEAMYPKSRYGVPWTMPVRGSKR